MNSLIEKLGTACEQDVPPLDLVIWGAGEKGTAFLEVCRNLPGINLLGMVDTNPDALGLTRAQELGVPILDPTKDPYTPPIPNVIVNMTSDPNLPNQLRTQGYTETEIIGASGTSLLGQFIQHEREVQDQFARAGKLASLGTLVSGIVHDINNPLYVILGLAEHIQDECKNEELSLEARDIARAARRITTICQNLTLYSRLSSSKDMEKVVLPDILDEAVHIGKFAIGVHDIKIIKHYTEKPFLFGKTEDFMQIFVNVVTNALQAMEGPGTLTLSTEMSPNEVMVEVKDTGKGIPLSCREQIFEPFFTTKPPGKGTGLGLHSVQTIVKKYEGQIFIQSEIGKGTTMRFLFPPTMSLEP
jgi:signal transduction histidine kinase